MSKLADKAGSNATLLGAATAVTLLLLGAGIYLGTRPLDPPLATPVAVVSTEKPAVKPAEAQAPVAKDAETAETTQTPEPQPTPVPPSIDEVRLEPDGLTVIAGRALPGSTVRVLLDGADNTSVTADRSGAFAAVTIIAPAPQPQVLTLVQRLGEDEVASVEEVILAPMAQPQPEAAPAEEDVVALADTQTEPAETTGAVSQTPETKAEGTGTEAASDSADSETAPTAAPADTETAETETPQTSETASTDTAETPAPETAKSATTGTETEAPATDVATASSDPETPATEPAKPAQVAILKSTEEGIELLAPSPEVMDNVALDTISYSQTGDVRLAGRAQSDASAVRVYLNNAPIAVLPVDPQGRWRGDLPQVDTGVYELRVDEVDTAGTVISRVVTPFKREDPEVLAAASDPLARAASVTVQTGDTLWAISRDRYGEGLLYVRVFQANRAAIRDPDLIYPGQVFALPD